MSFEIKRARGKTAVFSGTRHHCDQVPRLEDLCIQKLLNNANKIECVGDVPFYILKPLLTKVTLSQLKRIESYNPQLLDDPESDEPWKAHCRSHFENREPGKRETWRELFKRCERERDYRIEKIARRIKRHEEKAVPQRQTRVVDNQLPNGRTGAISTVIKKTIRHRIPARGGGHAGGPSTSSAAANSRPGSTTTTTVVIRREAANGSSGSRLLKPKTAPLMQKSWQLFKNRFRR